MPFRVDPRYAYVSTHIANLPRIATDDFRPPDHTSSDPAHVELQEPEYVVKLLGKSLDQVSGSPPLRSFVLARFSVLGPFFYNLATGFGATYRSNREIVHARIDIAALRTRCMTMVADRNLLSPNVRVSPDPSHQSSIDMAFLDARDFRSPNRAVFDAGVLAYGGIPLACVDMFVCVDGDAKETVGKAIGGRHEVIVDPSYFHRNKAPFRNQD